MIQKVQILCVQAHSKLFQYTELCGRKFLKRILIYLCCTKYNEINVCHFDEQNFTSNKNGINILYIGSYRSILIYNGQHVKKFKSAFKY